MPRVSVRNSVQADQRTGGNDIVEPDPTGAVVRHVLHRGLASTEELGHGANVLLRHVDGEPFGRLGSVPSIS